MSEQKVVKKGDIVILNYEGKLDSGEIFDSSYHGDHSHPLTFTAGNGEVVEGFDEEVIGMKEGEEKTFTIPSSKAYGDYRKELTQEVPKQNMPKGQEPEIGMMLVMNSPDGQEIPAMIKKVSESYVTIDLNHPLAGKNLTFKIKIDKIDRKS